MPPMGLIRALMKLRRTMPPTDTSFRLWAATIVGDEHAIALANFVGVTTYDGAA
jgi:hypothetical protein